MKLYILVAATLLLPGCASVVRGTTENVVVNAQPADATILTTLGHSCSILPCTIKVKRKLEFTAYAEKEGYKPGQIYIGSKFSGGGAAGLAGNVLIGGVIGVGVDAATGATLDHYPNPATIILVPVGDPGESTNIQKPLPAKPTKPKTGARTS